MSHCVYFFKSGQKVGTFFRLVAFANLVARHEGEAGQLVRYSVCVSPHSAIALRITTPDTHNWTHVMFWQVIWQRRQRRSNP